MAANYTLTGNFQQLTGVSDATGKVVLTLCNFGSAMPRVSGVGVITTAPVVATCVAGAFTVTFWGNDQIIPTGTYYSVQFLTSAGTPIATVAYQFTGGGSNDISTLTPLQTTPPVPFTAYAPLSSPAFTDKPTAPTATVGNNTTQLATTAFVLANGATPTTNLLISQFSPHADGVTDDTAAFTSAMAAFSEIWLDAGKSYAINSNLTITCSVRFLAGAKIIVGAGFTVTMNGNVLAPDNKQIFSSPFAATTFATLASDNMTRANENPISNGGNWVKGSTSGTTDAGQITSNKYGMVTIGHFTHAIWTGLAFPNDQWSEITLSNTGTNNGNSNNYVTVRDTSSASTLTAYLAFTTGAGAGTSVFLYRYVAGVGTQLFTSTRTVTTGDKLRIVAKGTSISLYHNGVLVTTQTDAVITSGAPGMALIDTVSISNTFNTAWKAGSVTTVASSGTVVLGPQASRQVFPEWFGAVADGTTDDGIAIQQAINSVSSAGLGFSLSSSKGGGTVILKGRTYAICAQAIYSALQTLTVAASYVNIVGQGQNNTSVLSGSSTADILSLAGVTGAPTTNACFGNKLSEFSVARSIANTSSTSAGIRYAFTLVTHNSKLYSLDSGSCYAIQNGDGQCNFYNCVAQSNLGTITQGWLNPNSCVSSMLVDCVCSGTMTNGMVITGGSDLFCDRFQTSIGGVGVSITGPTGDLHFYNSVIESGNTAFNISSNTGAGVICIVGGYFNNNTGGSVVITGSNNVSVQGGLFDVQGGNSAVTITGASKNNIISGLRIQVDGGTNTAIPISIDGTAGASNNTVTGCNISAPVGTPGSIGIRLINGAVRNSITGNVLSGFFTTGLSYDATSNNNTSTGNSVDATNITTPKSDLGTGNGAGL